MKTWFKKILAEGKIKSIEGKCYNGDEVTDDQVLEHCKLMFGAPVITEDYFPPFFEDDVLATIQLGRR